MRERVVRAPGVLGGRLAALGQAPRDLIGRLGRDRGACDDCGAGDNGR
jgi:hypothetical protein